VTEADIETCQQADDCMVVPYSHCCSTKRAVHRAFQYLYSDTPAWQTEPPGTPCDLIGQCRDDSAVTEASCDVSEGRCVLVFPDVP
jgi:hypothetical protein